MMVMRQYLVDGQPIALTEGFLHPDAARVSWSEAEQNSVVQIIESSGHTIDDVDLKIRADVAGQRGKYLGLQPLLILVLERVSADETGNPLEFTSLFMRSDVYEFGLNLKGPFHFADGF
jgi:DNA-binding GntR family transcriptional regulator